jgi:hypothetical protein
MRDLFRVLTISGALVLAVALAPVMAQTEGAPQDSSTSATPPAPTDTRRPVIGLNGSELPSAGAPETTQQSNAAAEAPKDAQGASVSNTAEASKEAGAPAAGATQDSNAAQDPEPPQFDRGVGSNSAPSAAIPRADMKKALSILRRSTRDYQTCLHIKACLVYFDSFGVAFTFADGTIAAYSHEQRGQISGHDCVINARGALSRGDRSMAVQWMMAAQSDILNRNWISDHPDAMVEALRTFRGWA